MAADGTQIKQDIDNNLANKGYRGIRVFNIITAMKGLIDWVTAAVNGNLSTWLKVSDNQPGGANADDVYRTGNTDFRGGMLAKTRTPNNSPLATVSHGGAYAIQVHGTNGGPAFLEFHLPGVRIDQLGVDTDGRLKVHPWGTTAAYAVLIDSVTSAFKMDPTLTNRKIVLYDSNGSSDHQFFGLGINDSVLRYQIPAANAAHIFYAGSSPATSVELMRITGAGNLAIGGNAPTTRLEVTHNPADGVVARIVNNAPLGTGQGAKLHFNQKGVTDWYIGALGNTSAFTISGWNGSSIGEVMRMDGFTAETSLAGPLVFGARSKAGWPVAAEIPAGKLVAYKNSSTNERRLYWNDGGTLSFTNFGI